MNITGEAAAAKHDITAVYRGEQKSSGFLCRLGPLAKILTSSSI